MKILAVADTECRALWDFYRPEMLADVDLILSCGDLDPDYLQFLVTMAGCPLLYVRGNHDEKYDRKPPLGCTCIEDRIYNYRGLRILGLGGSMRYRDGSDMYTESQMRARIRKLSWQIRLYNGFDILLTHAPAKDFGDMEDLPHRGFQCFNKLMERWEPAYMVHGHVHREYAGQTFERVIKHPAGTSVVNAWERTILDVGEGSYPPPGQTGSPLYDLWFRVQKSRRQGRHR